MKISLKALRVNAGYNQKEVAKKMGITEKTMQNWESNTTYPDAVQIRNLCDIYNCNLDDIFLPDTIAESEKRGSRENEKNPD